MSAPTTATTIPTKTKPKFRFRLTHGQHAHGRYVDELGINRQRIYSPGDIVESEYNLAARWPEKFTPVDDHATTTRPGPAANPQAPITAAQPVPQGAVVTDAELQRMTVKELTDLAASEEIDVRGSKDKAELIKIIRASFTA